ncbi:hypothetical protein EVAR_70759_1 [Eumeta japonica]|uniref:Uncharacterized protein n=1 Tax=Eumeta variegata TaxID=151549 RepID=A0A4C1SEV2_EUMVA|nr:hypothetical protein EVAR_70759_1 [Eumeta japonica]
MYERPFKICRAFGIPEENISSVLKSKTGENRELMDEMSTVFTEPLHGCEFYSHLSVRLSFLFILKAFFNKTGPAERRPPARGRAPKLFCSFYPLDLTKLGRPGVIMVIVRGIIIVECAQFRVDDFFTSPGAVGGRASADFTRPDNT